METNEAATAQPAAQPRPATSQPVSQSEADRYAAIVAPFLDRLEAQAQVIGRQDEQIRTMAEELAVVTAQRDQLQASAASPQEAGSGATAAEKRTGPFWRSWWEEWKRRHP